MARTKRLRSFQHLVYEIALDFKSDISGFELSAVEALQKASEDFLVGIFAEANHRATHQKRDTIYPVDMWIACPMCGLHRDRPYYCAQERDFFFIVAMGLHQRLGQQSLLRALDDHILRIIFKILF